MNFVQMLTDFLQNALICIRIGCPSGCPPILYADFAEKRGIEGSSLSKNRDVYQNWVFFFKKKGVKKSILEDLREIVKTYRGV